MKEIMYLVKVGNQIVIMSQNEYELYLIFGH
jgi:hypothetical protein